VTAAWRALSCANAKEMGTAGLGNKVFRLAEEEKK
jgi:hypothetical protein